MAAAYYINLHSSRSVSFYDGSEFNKLLDLFSHDGQSEVVGAWLKNSRPGDLLVVGGKVIVVASDSKPSELIPKKLYQVVEAGSLLTPSEDDGECEEEFEEDAPSKRPQKPMKRTY